jgi:hypothetical protein
MVTKDQELVIFNGDKVVKQSLISMETEEKSLGFEFRTLEKQNEQIISISGVEGGVSKVWLPEKEPSF